MQYNEQREVFYRVAVERGICSEEGIRESFPLGTEVPRELLNKWLGRLLHVPRKFADQRRYVNRFKIGADPEFIFMDQGSPVRGNPPKRVDANKLGFKQGLAFGADNNGRLMEIRPYPSRSALEVVASVLLTFRWMALFRPSVRGLDWMCGAFLAEDGIGGHVHFGRKRPTRMAEIEALDNIEATLMQLGVYPAEEVIRRRGGDARRQVYGLPGDYRLQSHGYEYRTFPSWLDSPELAFFTLVLSKLAVHSPEWIRWKKGRHDSPEACLQRIKNLLAFYRNSDDDARLALVLLDRIGLPAHRGGDFKGRWGIAETRETVGKIQIVPTSFKPREEDVKEVFDYLLKGEQIGFRKPTPGWSPLTVPSGYQLMINDVETTQKKGLGELVHDLCYHEKQILCIDDGGNHGEYNVLVSKEFAANFPSGWRTKYEGLQSERLNSSYIRIPAKAREGSRFSLTRRILTSGLLPVWRVKDVKPESFAEWKAKQKPPKNRFVGKVLFETGIIPGVR